MTFKSYNLVSKEYKREWLLNEPYFKKKENLKENLFGIIYDSCKKKFAFKFPELL